MLFNKIFRIFVMAMVISVVLWSSAQAQDDQGLIREAAADPFHMQVGPGEVGAVEIIGDWALVSYRAESGPVALGLAQWDGDHWTVIPEGADGFAVWLADAPASLLSDEAKAALSQDASIAHETPGFWLPFPVGQVWRYLRGPNPGLSAIDLGPFTFEETIREDPNPTFPLTGQERDVNAAAAGIIVDKRANLLIIRHAGGWETGYDSLAAASNFYRIGETVLQGQRIGYASNELGTSRAVVRFFLRRNGTPQSLQGEVFSDWRVETGSGLPTASPFTGRLVYRNGVTRFDCPSVDLAQLDPSNCHIRHFSDTPSPLPPAAIQLQPTSPITIGIGETETVRVSAANLFEVYRVRLVVRYGLVNAVSVVDAFPDTPAIEVEPGSVFLNTPVVVIENRVNPASGVIYFDLQLESPALAISGSGTLAEIAFRRHAPGTAGVYLAEVSLFEATGALIPVDPDSITQVDLVSQPVLIQGQISLQGRENVNGLTLTNHGQAVPVTPAGQFTLSVQESYSLRAFAPGYLPAQAEGALSSDSINLGLLQLPGGDINSDNSIDILDMASIGQQYGQPLIQADVNGDRMVDIVDMALTASNYGQTGPLVWE